MKSSTPSHSEMRAVQVGPEAILAWLGELHAWSKTASFADQLDLDGLNVVDACLSPLYLAVLNAIRRAPSSPAPVMQAIISRVRNEGYHVKTRFWERMAAWQSAKARPVDVLLWSRDITHSSILQPVCKSLLSLEVPAAVMMCQSNVFLRLRDRTAVCSLGAWPQIVQRARQDGHRRAKALANTGTWDLPRFEGVPPEVLEPAVRSTVIRSLYQVAEARANTIAALDKFQPKVLVVGNDITLEGRIGCRVAAARGVPTALFMHGSITGDVLQSSHCADRIMVYGPVHRQELLHYGVAAERIATCGAPYLDDHVRQTQKTHPMLRARLGLHASDPWILVATSGPGHRISHAHHQLVIQNVMSLCTTLPDLPVVVKLHRKDKLEYYQQGLKNCPNGRLFVVAHDAHGFPRGIFEWLQGCRIVLTGASTVAMEAMIMNVPVVTMDFRDEIHNVDFIDQGATVHVTTADALEFTTREILTRGGHTPEVKHRVQEFLEASFFALDGNSALRGANALREMFPGGPTSQS